MKAICSFQIFHCLLFTLLWCSLPIFFPAIELITELMHSEVGHALLRGLVAFLKPTKERIPKHKILEGKLCCSFSLHLFAVYNQNSGSPITVLLCIMITLQHGNLKSNYLLFFVVSFRATNKIDEKQTWIVAWISIFLSYWFIWHENHKQSCAVFEIQLKQFLCLVRSRSGQNNWFTPCAPPASSFC